MEKQLYYLNGSGSRLTYRPSDTIEVFDNGISLGHRSIDYYEMLGNFSTVTFRVNGRRYTGFPRNHPELSKPDQCVELERCRKHFTTDELLEKLHKNNIKLFYMTAKEMRQHGKDSCWYNHTEKKYLTAGYYAWCAFPGCLPEGEPMYCGKSNRESIQQACEFFINE